jgi:hypothetical protein
MTAPDPLDSSPGPARKGIAALLRHVDEELAHDVDEQQRRWRYRLRRGRAWFDDEARQAHQRLRQAIPAYIRESSLRNILSAPIIYSLIVPLAFLDLWLSVYQWICFPIYGIAIVRRGKYFVFDRRHLAYLNGVEKANCTFCSYANGLIAYVREIAARTEQYWCPIRHARKTTGPHGHYHLFFEYGDGERYHRDLMKLRGELASNPAESPGPQTSDPDVPRG